MKNYKQFISGVIVGSVLIGSGNVLAKSDSFPTITNWVKYNFNGVDKPLPDGYTTVNYEGHTYVPARFIAEELGANVEWNDNTKTVLITKSEVTDSDNISNETNEQNGNKGENEDSSDQGQEKYEQLPVAKTINGVRVEVYDIEQNTDFTKFYVIVKNTTKNLIQLEQSTAYLQTNEDKYTNKEINGAILYWKDNAWFNAIEEDDDVEGYIMLPPISTNERQGELHVEVLENGLNKNLIEYNFNIKW